MSFDLLNYAANKNKSELETCINTTIPVSSRSQGANVGLCLADDSASWNCLCTKLNNKFSYCLTNNAGIGQRYSPFSSSNWGSFANSDLCVFGHQETAWAAAYINSCTCFYFEYMIPTLVRGNTTFAGCTDGGVEFCGFKVCTTNLDPSIGACCQWTVPAGVTTARFQLWGTGGRSSNACCCGGSIGGTSGAYASVIIPVTPGCTYTLCVGAGCLIPLFWNNTGTQACPTYVTGYGLCNLCARGGTDVNHCLYMCYQGSVPGSGVTTDAVFSFKGCSQAPAGSCMCNTGMNFCQGGSCSSCGATSMVYDYINTGFYGCYYDVDGTHRYKCCSTLGIGTFFGTSVHGIPGMMGSICYDTSFYGLYYDPPIYGFAGNCNCCICFAGTSIGGIRCNHLDTVARRVPSAGGIANFLYSGCTLSQQSSSLVCGGSGTACGGDIGRSGMICVTFC